MTLKGTLVECYGLPGCGKSTLCARLDKELDCLTAEGVRAYWKQNTTVPEKLRFVAAVVFELKMWRTVAKAAWKLGIWKTPDGIRRFATLPFLRARADILLPQYTLVLDQFLMQEIWSALVSARNFNPDPKPIEDLLRSLYEGVSARLLCFDVDNRQAAERIANRTGGYSRFEGLSAESIAGRLRPTEELIGTIAEAAALTGLRIQQLDARRGRAQLVTDALAALKQTE